MCYHKTIKEMPPMNGWLYVLITVVTEAFAMGGHFCVLLLSFCPIVYPSAKQVKPKLKTASSTSTVIILQALLSEIHNSYSVSSLRRVTGPSEESQPSTVMVTPRMGLYHTNTLIDI